MLTFEQKQAILEDFPQLTKKEISMKRINYHFEESLFEKTIVVEKLHPNGNGFVFVGDLEKYKEQSVKGLVNVRDFSEAALREIIQDAINYLAEEIDDSPIVEIWTNEDGTTLELVYNYQNYSVYHNKNLEDTFGTREAAVEYLEEEGFNFSKQL
ncbi:MAG: hypothetical protein ABS882_01140 [Lysinibacillus sp.]